MAVFLIDMESLLWMVLLSKRRDRRPIEYHIAHEATEDSKLELRGGARLSKAVAPKSQKCG